MILLFLKSLLSDEIIQAICWTLVHSLWQGLLLAIFAGIVVLLTKKSNAFIRYNLLSILFFAFLLMSGATFLREIRIAQEADQISRIVPGIFSTPIRHNPVLAADVVFPVAAPTAYLEIFVGYFNLHASLVVMIWFIIFSARFVRVLANLGYIQRVRHYRTHAPADYWRERLTDLAAGLKIKKHIALLESELVKVPLMLGFLKPLILIPFGLLAQLPADQVEAILLHELAHIKRKDYLVNLLQSFSETIFFFNPGVLWISTLIREERENCCDDIAIKKTKSKNEFVHALVAFHQYQDSGPQYGIGFSRNNNHLLNRLRRILTNNNKTLNNVEKVFLASAIVVTGFFTVSFSQTAQQNPAPSKDSVKATDQAGYGMTGDVLQDSIPIGKEKISGIWKTDINWNGKNYRITEKNNKVTELYIDDQRIPDEKIAGYMPQIDEIRKNQKEKENRFYLKERDLKREQSELIQKQEELERQMEVLNRRQAELSREQDRISGIGEQDLLRYNADKQKMEMDKQVRVLDKLKMEQDELAERTDRDSKLNNLETLEQYKKMAEDRQKYMEERNKSDLQDFLKQEKQMTDERKAQLGDLNKDLEEKLERLRSAQLDAKNGLSMDGTDNAYIQALTRKIQALSEKEKQFNGNRLDQLDLANKLSLDAQLNGSSGGHQLMNMDGQGILNSMNHKQINLIIDLLMDEKIISSAKNISFELNSKEFILNGVTQSPELFTQLKERFIMNKNDHFIYSSKGNSTHVDVHTANGDENLTEKAEK